MAESQAQSDSDLVRFAAGEVVFREGDEGNAVYVVLDGKIELRVGGRLVETVGPGGVLGEMALIERAPRVATATAKTACDLQPISDARFMAMIQERPHFALQIMQVMAARLRTMDARLAGSPRPKRPRDPSSRPRRPTSRPKAGRRRTSRR